jgi:MFS family permease
MKKPKKKMFGYSTIVEENLKNSVVEGSADSAKIGFGESYFSAYAIKVLNATNFQIGLLTAIPRLFGFLSELFSSNILDRVKNRKRMLRTFSLIHALMFIPIFLSFMFIGYETWFLIFFVTAYFVAGYIIAPVWISLIGDIVPDRIKGSYFGKRNEITGFVGFVSLLMGGILLQYFSGINVIFAFGLIFLAAMIAKLISSYCFSRVYEPEYVVEDGSKFSFISFIKRMRSTNYGIFVLYLCLFSFSVQIAGPFFAVYMLRDLNFNYLNFTLVTGASAVASFLSMPLWGKYANTFGNRRIIALTGVLIPFVPLLWFFSRSIFHLIPIELFSGFVWAGFNLCSFNFVFDTVSPQKRARAFSYYNVLCGVFIFLGATLGGYLVRYGNMFWSPIHLLFLISGISRFLMSLFFLPKIREVKEVKKISGGKLLLTILTSEIWRGVNQRIIMFRKKKDLKKNN